MKKYPKTYWNFIKWMYKILMYRLDKEKNTFRLFKSYDGNKLEFVSFMTFNHSVYNKIVNEKFKAYYKNYITKPKAQAFKLSRYIIPRKVLFFNYI